MPYLFTFSLYVPLGLLMGYLSNS